MNSFSNHDQSDANDNSGDEMLHSITEKRREIKVNYSITRKIALNDHRLIENRIVSALKDDEIISAYKVLRTRILHKLKANRWNAIGVMSAHAQAGSTLTAVNTAISIAQELTHSVLLVDFNFKNPGIASALGFTPEYGLEDYLFDDVELGKILVNPGVDRMVVLPCREIIPDASELMSSPRIIELVDELKTRYPTRVVVFDLPPALEGDEVLSFSSYIDALLLVVQENRTTKEELALLADLLKGVPMLGTILNKSGK